jgi:hypothetical protein
MNKNESNEQNKDENFNAKDYRKAEYNIITIPFSNRTRRFLRR